MSHLPKFNSRFNRSHPVKTLYQTALLTLIPLSTVAQGTFVYDQQSSTESRPGESFARIQPDAPLGQSFTPSLTTVGFIRLDLYDDVNHNGKGATIYVNLRANSITGPILSSSIPVSMPDGFAVAGGGFTDFLFQNLVPVTPGTIYYFDLAAQPGSDTWGLRRYLFGSDYTGGTEYISGQPGTDDLWFREGIIVPEPSSVALLLFGTVILFWNRRVRHR